VTTYRQSTQSNFEKFKDFRDGMVQRGIYFHPDGTERLALSTTHTDEDVEKTLATAEEVLRILPKRVPRSFSFF
jgi:glutamate-1-semialdehyde 2,1-aminomutase